MSETPAWAEVMGSLSNTTGNSSLEPHPKDFAVSCGKDMYITNKDELVGQSDYFAIVCNVGKAITDRKIKLHPKRQREVRALMHFFKHSEYIGPISNPGVSTPTSACEESCNQAAGEENGFTVEIRSNDQAVIHCFPEFEDNCLIDGDMAVKICRIITTHALFQVSRPTPRSSPSAAQKLCACITKFKLTPPPSQKNNEHGFQFIEFSYYRCQLDLLPRPIQLELYLFFWHIRMRDTGLSSNAVFHATMFDTAVKYLVPEMKAPIAHAFRHGVTPWINTALCSDTSFLRAVQIIWAPRFPVGDSQHDELADAMIKVMAENWGWMQHDDDVRMLMMNHEYEYLYYGVVHTARMRRKKWEQKLWDPSLSSGELS
ncbi:hypothetical protein K504DRAFT_500654 [Pleomassaria siparia CBS 279.74]|uniref:BTB domain-containing protein n=1 Tax=Pleomassaria siparia CBS 279.74 TaxID=1314801 RepID=A0A6G1KCS9_9PLEO|nr:hypothetical protein K504DRAFT_500654 [Pleomassaria siparia CBS 279.74]